MNKLMGFLVLLFVVCFSSAVLAGDCPKKMEYKGEQACVSSDVPADYYGVYHYPSGQKAELVLGKDGRGYRWYDAVKYKQNFEWGVLYENGAPEETILPYSNNLPGKVLVMHFDDGSYEYQFMFEAVNNQGSKSYYVGNVGFYFLHD
jgi:hypothetical protein